MKSFVPFRAGLATPMGRCSARQCSAQPGLPDCVCESETIISTKSAVAAAAAQVSRCRIVRFNFTGLGRDATRPKLSSDQADNVRGANASLKFKSVRSTRNGKMWPVSRWMKVSSGWKVLQQRRGMDVDVVLHWSTTLSQTIMSVSSCWGTKQPSQCAQQP